MKIYYQVLFHLGKGHNKKKKDDCCWKLKVYIFNFTAVVEVLYNGSQIITDCELEDCKEGCFIFGVHRSMNVLVLCGLYTIS